MATPEMVLEYWIDELGPEGWYAGGKAIDDAIRQRFLPVWEALERGQFHDWLCSPVGTLAYLIVADQFPRNMFRGEPRAFATDHLARAAVHRALARGFDLEIPEPQRQFFYLPLEHSECKADQSHAVRLILTRMPETGPAILLHARAHREIIREFGRFPFRNQALGRQNTPAEDRFLADGAYGAVLRRLSA